MTTPNLCNETIYLLSAVYVPELPVTFEFREIQHSIVDPKPKNAPKIDKITSHNTYVLCLYMSGGTYCLGSTPNDRFLRIF